VCATKARITAINSTGIVIIATNVSVLTSEIVIAMIMGTEVAVRTIDRSGFTTSRDVAVVFVTLVTVIANNRGVPASTGRVTSIVGACVVVIAIVR